jgi:ComF family protein
MRQLPERWRCMKHFAKEAAGKSMSAWGIAGEMQRACGRISAAFKEALYPSTCLMCGKFFRDGNQGTFSVSGNNTPDAFGRFDLEKLFSALMGSYLCPACIQTFTAVTSPLCRQCGVMFKGREGEDHLCEGCLRSENYFGIARAAGVYNRAMMAVIHSFKYSEKVQLARPLSLLLLAVFLKYWRQRPIDLIVPVPLYKKRLRKRGFNQSYLIVKDWPVLLTRWRSPGKDVHIDPYVLQRTRPTLPQTGLGRKDRMSNVKKAFALTSPEKVKDRRVLIIDDVLTTGATANECTRVLLGGGAKAVDILTVARAM